MAAGDKASAEKGAVDKAAAEKAAAEKAAAAKAATEKAEAEKAAAEKAAATKAASSNSTLPLKPELKAPTKLPAKARELVPAPALSTAEEKDAKRAEVGRLIALAAQPPQLIAAAKQADKPYLI